MEQDRARGRQKGWGAREGAEKANRQRKGRMKRNRGRGRWEKEGERCEGRRESGRAREKGAGSGLPAAERTAHRSEDTRRLRAPCCPSEDSQPRAPGQAPLPGSAKGPSPVGSAPARPRRRVPGAQPRADRSGRRGSAAGLSGPGWNKGARRRGRGQEAPPAEELGASAPRGRAQPPTLPGQPGPRSGGRGRCLLPAPSALPGAYRCGAPPGPGPQRLEGHSGGRASRPLRQAVSEELEEKAHPGARSGPHAPQPGEGRAHGEQGNLEPTAEARLAVPGPALEAAVDPGREAAAFWEPVQGRVAGRLGVLSTAEGSRESAGWAQGTNRPGTEATSAGGHGAFLGSSFTGAY